MKTPITDTLWKSGPAALEVLEHARRLELDRAALMEALEECEMDFSCYEGDPKYPAKNATLRTIRAALSAAYANFPEP